MTVEFPKPGDVSRRRTACCRFASAILHENGFTVAWHCNFHGNILRTGYEPAILEMPLMISIGKRPLRDIALHQLEMMKRFHWKLEACSLHPDVYLDTIDSVSDRIEVDPEKFSYRGIDITPSATVSKSFALFDGS